MSPLLRLGFSGFVGATSPTMWHVPRLLRARDNRPSRSAAAECDRNIRRLLRRGEAGLPRSGRNSIGHHRQTWIVEVQVGSRARPTSVVGTMSVFPGSGSIAKRRSAMRRAVLAFSQISVFGRGALSGRRRIASPTISRSNTAAGRTSWLARSLLQPEPPCCLITFLHCRHIALHFSIQYFGFGPSGSRPCQSLIDPTFITRAVNGFGHSILRAISTTVVVW